MNLKNGLYFIAEIGVNHEGNYNLAKKIILEAKKSGANAIKLQSYKAEKIASKYATSYWDRQEEIENNQLKLFKKFDGLNYEDYNKLIELCRNIKIDFIVTPFDTESVVFFKEKVKFFKISSSDITNYLLLEKISKTKKKIILSTGASTFDEINDALKIFKSYPKENIKLLHCILNYPTKRYNANLNMIDHLKKLGYEVGISDHTKPKDSHNVLLYAYAKGARIIEKHFTYNKSKKGNDHYHSFDWRDLKKFKKNITDLNHILGRSLKTFIKSEVPSRHHARRSLFYIKNLSKHSKLSKRDLISLRPATGIPPKNYNQIIGKRLNYNVEEGQIVKMKDFIRN